MKDGRYVVPLEENCGYSVEMFPESISKFSFPNGAYWTAVAEGKGPVADHLGLQKH